MPVVASVPTAAPATLTASGPTRTRLGQKKLRLRPARLAMCSLPKAAWANSTRLSNGSA